MPAIEMSYSKAGAIEALTNLLESARRELESYGPTASANRSPKVAAASARVAALQVALDIVADIKSLDECLPIDPTSPEGVAQALDQVRRIT